MKWRQGLSPICTKSCPNWVNFYNPRRHWNICISQQIFIIVIANTSTSMSGEKKKIYASEGLRRDARTAWWINYKVSASSWLLPSKSKWLLHSVCPPAETITSVGEFLLYSRVFDARYSVKWAFVWSCERKRFIGMLWMSVSSLIWYWIGSFPCLRFSLVMRF